MEIVLFGVASVLVLIGGFRLLMERPWQLIAFAAAFLAAAYLLFTFSWDLWHITFSGIGLGPQVLVFATGPASLVCLVISLFLIGKALRTPAARFTPVALLPCLIAIAHHEYGELEIARKDARDASAYIRARQVRREGECIGAGSRNAIAMCRAIVAKSKAENDAALRAQGNSYAARVILTDPRQCSLNSTGLDSDPDFVAGCVEAVVANRRNQGVEWALKQHFITDEDCKPTDQALPTPESVDGCKAETLRARKGAAESWAVRNAVFTVEECEAMPDREDRADFVNACQEFLRHYRQTGSDASFGRQWASVNAISDPEACHSVNRHFTPAFVKGCEDFLRQMRERGQGWARANDVATEAECKTKAPRFEEHAAFMAGCMDVARMAQ
jgi:hypothetical protein